MKIICPSQTTKKPLPETWKVMTKERIQHFKEVISDHRRIVLALIDACNQPATQRRLTRRLNLLETYGEISDTKAGQYVLSNVKLQWFESSKSPNSAVSDFKMDLLLKPEILRPMVLSAAALKAAVNILSLWREDKLTILEKLVVRLPPNQKTIHQALNESTDSLEQTVKQNRARNAQVIADLLARQRSKKYRSGRTVHRNLALPTPVGIEYQTFCFKNGDVAWYYNNHRFSSLSIEPFKMPANQQMTEAFVRAMCKDQLVKIANAMMMGLRPACTIDATGNSSFKYLQSCDWHIIATAFAETLSTSVLKIRLCVICGTDIRLRKINAVKCLECYSRKRV